MDEVGQTIYKCDLCGKNFVLGNDEDGIPDGVQFNFSNGTTFTFCIHCVVHRYPDIIKIIDDNFDKGVYPATINMTDTYENS